MRIFQPAPEPVLGVLVVEHAPQMPTRQHPQASIVEGGFAKRQPAGEVVLRLYVRPSVVLMPRELPGMFGFLVDRLIPVDPHRGPEQIPGKIAENRRSAETPKIR